MSTLSYPLQDVPIDDIEPFTSNDSNHPLIDPNTSSHDEIAATLSADGRRITAADGSGGVAYYAFLDQSEYVPTDTEPASTSDAEIPPEEFDLDPPPGMTIEECYEALERTRDGVSGASSIPSPETPTWPHILHLRFDCVRATRLTPILEDLKTIDDSAETAASYRQESAEKLFNSPSAKDFVIAYLEVSSDDIYYADYGKTFAEDTWYMLAFGDGPLTVFTLDNQKFDYDPPEDPEDSSGKFDTQPPRAGPKDTDEDSMTLIGKITGETADVLYSFFSLRDFPEGEFEGASSSSDPIR